MSEDIYEEIENAWKAVCATLGSEQPFHKIAPALSAAETEAKKEAAVGLQPYLAIFEAGLDWMAALHVALEQKRTETSSARFRATWALVGSAASFATSIRVLSLCGLDTPAKALLRTYVESLLLCLAILRDETLAEEFANARDDAAVKNFWHTSASPKKLHTRIIDLEKDSGLSAEAEGLASFRRQEYEILSQSSHLSYVGAVLTVSPPTLHNPDAVQRGLIGGANHFSVRTLRYAIFATWHFCRFSYREIFRKDDLGLVLHDPKDEWHLRVFVGREVYSHIVPKYWPQL